MKKVILVIISLFLLNIVLALITGRLFDLEDRFTYSFFIFMFSLPFFGSIFKERKRIIYTILGYAILVLIINVGLEKKSLFYSFFSFLLFFIIFMYSGFLLRKHKKFLFIPILVLVIFIKFGFNDYQAYISGINYNKVTSLSKISFFNKDKKIVRLDTIKDKIIVLDIWMTKCGICLKKFPSFDKVANQYKENPNVIFYAMNIPYKNQTMEESIAFAKNNLPYNFNHLFTKGYQVLDSLQISGVPKLLIIKNNKIYYKGYLITNSNTKIHNITTEIEKSLHL